MNKFILSLALLLSSHALASPLTADSIYGPTSGGFILYNGQDVISFPSYQSTESVLTQNNVTNVEGKTFDASSNVMKEAYYVFDYSILGGAVGQYFLSQVIPNKAVIVNASIDVITQPTGSGAPTISIGAQTAGDILGSTAIGGMTVGQWLGKPVFGSTAHSFKLTAATTAAVQITTNALTAGKFAIVIDYFVSQ